LARPAARDPYASDSRLDRVEVADGVAVVLGLSPRITCRQVRVVLRVFGIPRVPAFGGRLVRGDGGEHVAHHDDAARSDLEHSAYDGVTVVKTSKSLPSVSCPAFG